MDKIVGLPHLRGLHMAAVGKRKMTTNLLPLFFVPLTKELHEL